MVAGKWSSEVRITSISHLRGFSVVLLHHYDINAGRCVFNFRTTFCKLNLLCAGPIHESASDGVCVIGLKPFGYIPLLTYDV